MDDYVSAKVVGVEHGDAADSKIRRRRHSAPKFGQKFREHEGGPFLMSCRFGEQRGCRACDIVVAVRAVLVVFDD